MLLKGHILFSLTAFMVLLTYCLTGSAKTGAPLANADQTVTIVQGKSVTLRADQAGGVTYQWLRDGSPIAGATQRALVVNSAGAYQVQTVNVGNCASELSDRVVVTVIPAASTADMVIGITASQPSKNAGEPIIYTITVINNGPTTATGINVTDVLPPEVKFGQLIPNPSAPGNYTDADQTIRWTIGQLQPGETATLTFTAIPLKPGDVTNTATVTAAQPDANPENNTATVIVTSTGITIPNVFTPNGDGVNDTFFIPGLAAYPTNEFTVMNRWGATVYQKKNYQGDWTGSGLNEGTYFYILRIQQPSGKWDSYKGYITLLRTKK